MRLFVRCLAAALVIAPLCGWTPSQPLRASETSADEIDRSFRVRDYARAEQLIEEHLARQPDDGIMLYNAACATARLGKPQAAAAYLLRAVKAGFHDFSRMRRDPDLQAVRTHPIYKALLDARNAADALLSAKRIDQWREKYGAEAYRFESDPQRRITYAIPSDHASADSMRSMLDRQADQMVRTLFEMPPEHNVLVALPTAADASAIFANPHVHGTYSHLARLLIAADFAASLRHEFVHVFHHSHMDRVGQQHAMWAQEGLASLYEEYELGSDGSIVFLPNERRNIVKAMARDNTLIPWEHLFALSDMEFGERPAQHYAQARSIFEFLAERGRLEAWYRAYVEHFERDQKGAAAFEAVFEQPLAQTELDWRMWLETKATIVTQQHVKRDPGPLPSEPIDSTGSTQPD